MCCTPSLEIAILFFSNLFAPHLPLFEQYQHRSPFPQLPTVYPSFLFPIVPSSFQPTPYSETPIHQSISSTPSQTQTCQRKPHQNHPFHPFHHTKPVPYLAINVNTQINGVALIGIVSCSFSFCSTSDQHPLAISLVSVFSFQRGRDCIASYPRVIYTSLANAVSGSSRLFAMSIFVARVSLLFPFSSLSSSSFPCSWFPSTSPESIACLPLT